MRLKDHILFHLKDKHYFAAEWENEISFFRKKNTLHILQSDSLEDSFPFQIFKLHQYS